MRYIRFIIQNYRAIDGPMEIDVSKESLFPIIGVNECGKTTILHALFAFDQINDALNNNGRHLQDVTNLYSVAPKDPLVAADVAITFNEFLSCLDRVVEDNPNEFTPVIRSYKRLRSRFPSTLRITRNVRSCAYPLDESVFWHKELNEKLAASIIVKLPFLLFFDDFRDSVENRVEIVKSQSASG